MADAQQLADEETKVRAWAASRNISADTCDVVVALGFSSLEALSCLEAGDLKKSQVPIGQQKLLLRCVAKQPATSNTDDSTRDETPSQQPAPIEAPPARESPPAPVDNAAPSTSAGAVDGSGGEDAFVRQLREQLSVEQGTRQAARSAIPPAAVDGATGMVNTELPGMLSWQNPQIHLQPVSVTGSFHDITDFVDNMPTETDKVVSSTDDYQLICRSGPRKTKLENLAVNQWSVANIAILHKLVQDGMLPLSQVFDYMSYTTYLYRLMNAYDLVSVYMYDREYRRLQHAHKFRWGTVVGHLSTQHLRLRQSKENVGSTRTSRQNGSGQNSKAYNNGNQSKVASHSLDGKPICRNFNGRGGCNMTDCRYMHVCNVPGCYREHPSVSHADHVTKN